MLLFGLWETEVHIREGRGRACLLFVNGKRKREVTKGNNEKGAKWFSENEEEEKKE